MCGVIKNKIDKKKIDKVLKFWVCKKKLEYIL